MFCRSKNRSIAASKRLEPPTTKPLLREEYNGGWAAGEHTVVPSQVTFCNGPFRRGTGTSGKRLDRRACRRPSRPPDSDSLGRPPAASSVVVDPDVGPLGRVLQRGPNRQPLYRFRTPCGACLAHRPRTRWRSIPDRPLPPLVARRRRTHQRASHGLGGTPAQECRFSSSI